MCGNFLKKQKPYPSFIKYFSTKDDTEFLNVIAFYKQILKGAKLDIIAFTLQEPRGERRDDGSYKVLKFFFEDSQKLNGIKSGRSSRF